MCQRELAEKKEEEERDYWFNRLRPMTKPKQMWQKKWLAKEEGCSSGEEASKVTPTRGEDNPKSSDWNRSWVTATRNRETTTQSWVTVTWTRVTAAQVRRMTGKVRSQS
jgi:16S rRNA U516 pseudouridylate synthase RsuA-like enzyme